MPTNPTAPSTVPEFPALSDRVNYNAKAYAWAQHMDLVYPGEMYSLASVTYTNAVEVASNTAAAISSAAAALASETAAASYTNVARWVSGANYAVDVVRFSPITNLVYRCIATATGRTVDPSSDTGYWSSALVQTVASGGTGATTAAGAQATLNVPSRTGGGASGTWTIDILGNAASATTAAACTGNAASATTAQACTGNAASATTAAACTGNAATATVAANALGQGQTLQNLTASRAMNTTYTNSTGRLIWISLSVYIAAGSYIELRCIGDGNKVDDYQSNIGTAGIYATLRALVPADWTYIVLPTGASAVIANGWHEMR